MAKADSTARTESISEIEGAYGRLSLESINPLIVGDGWNGDTAHCVKCALLFLADAIPLTAEGGFTPDMRQGVNVILRTIAAAVEVCHE